MHAFIPTLITNLSQSPFLTPHFAYIKADSFGEIVDITLEQCSVAAKCIQLFSNIQFDASSYSNYGR